MEESSVCRPSEGPVSGQGGGVSSQEEHLLLGPSVSRSSDDAEKSSPEPVRGTRAAGLQGTGKATVAKRKASTGAIVTLNIYCAGCVRSTLLRQKQI